MSTNVTSTPSSGYKLRKRAASPSYKERASRGFRGEPMIPTPSASSSSPPSSPPMSPKRTAPRSKKAAVLKEEKVLEDDKLVAMVLDKEVVVVETTKASPSRKGAASTHVSTETQAGNADDGPASAAHGTMQQHHKAAPSMVPLLILGASLALALAVLYMIINSFKASDFSTLSLPTTETYWNVTFWIELKEWANQAENLDRTAGIVRGYLDSESDKLVLAYVVAFLTFQSFCIPGCTALIILGGAVFDFWLAFCLAAVCTAVGCTFAYYISKFVGELTVERYFARWLARIRSEVRQHANEVFYYVLFLRVAPFPNWVINLTSPHVGVPVHVFMSATFWGLLPLSYAYVSVGQTLSESKSKSVGEISRDMLLNVGLPFTLVVLLSIFLRRRLRHD